MGLSSVVREVAGVTIVSLDGRLEFGEATKLRQQVEALVQEGKKLLILELRNVSYIDSSGLGALMGCYTAARNGGGALKLLKPSRRVRNVLTVVKLFPVFETFEDEDTAVASFTRSARA